MSIDLFGKSGSGGAREHSRALERAAPELLRADIATHVDLALLRFNTSGAAGITDIRRPLYGIGFTGQLPPGACLLVVPYERRADLVTAISAASIPNMRRQLFNFSVSAVSLASLQILALRAGDVVAFQEQLRQGVSVFAFSMWSDIGANSGFLDSSGGYTTSATNDDDYMPHARAAARAFLTPGVPSRISWTPVPWISHFATSSTSSPAGTSGNCVVGPHATHVTIQLVDDTNDPAPITAAETGDYEIWWRLASGLWVHNPLDDFDGAGRGTAGYAGAGTELHDVEVYEVPRNVMEVVVRRMTGNVFGWIAIATDNSPAW